MSVAEERSYSAWTDRFDTIGPRQRILVRRRLRALRRQPLISIILPVYNADLEHLAAAIGSVRSQLYDRWELCIADDCSTKAAVAPFLREQVSADARIKLTLREQNGHIAACSNSALALVTGDWIALFDQDDLLPEHALALVAAAIERNPQAGLIYSDEDKLGVEGNRCDPFFKPDWNPTLFLGQNFVSHLGVYRTSLVRELGGFREGFEGSQDYDLALRCAERLAPEQIHHIPRVLYHWRKSVGSVAATGEAKPYAVDAARRCIADHLQRTEMQGQVAPCPENPHWHRVLYDLPAQPAVVSVVIPTRDRLPLLQRCFAGLREKTDYAPLEIIIVDNGSVEPKTRAFLEDVAAKAGVKVVQESGEFNFSRLINRGAAAATGEFLLLLNNDIEVTEPGWLAEMVSQCTQRQVGAVGARLWFPNRTLQHAGVILGVGGVANHAFYGASARPIAINLRTFALAQNYSAVTAACMLVRRSVFHDSGGFDEALPVNFNDIDFCLRMTARGWLIVWTPYANLIHHESSTRGRGGLAADLPRLFEQASLIERRWGWRLLRDPYYHPGFSLYSNKFEFAFPPRWENEAAMTEAEEANDS